MYLFRKQLLIIRVFIVKADPINLVYILDIFLVIKNNVNDFPGNYLKYAGPIKNSVNSAEW